MRIAYLTCVYPPYPGGMGYQAQGLSKEMVRRGHQVDIVAPHTTRPWLRFDNAAFLPQVFWRLRDVDIIHVLYPFYGTAELIPFLKRVSRAKIVVHHLMDAVALGWLGRVFRLHAKYMAPRIFRAADKVLVLSEDYARNSDVARYGVAWEVVPNGVDTTLFWLTLHDSKSIIPTILFVGGLDRAHYFKGVPVLIKACAILKERGVKFQCQIVGEGELRRGYEEQAKAAGLMLRGPSSGCPEDGPPYIRFIGLVLHEQLPAYYQRATVVVVPATARVECFSMVAAEAQACGVPVIVSDFPGVRVTIEDGLTGLVVRPNDPEKLAQILEELLNNPQKIQTMGLAARKLTVERYDWKIIGDKLEKIYQAL